MQQVFLYIQVKPQDEIRFGNVYSHWLKSEFPEVIALDADNHSEGLVIEHELKMLQAADKVVLILEVMEGVTPGKAAKLLETVLRSKTTEAWIYKCGEHMAIDRMLKLSKAVYQQDFSDTDLKAAILGFFNESG